MEDVALIITDQRMPGMSGTDLLRESMQTSPGSLRIIMTGYTDLEALKEAINSSKVYRFVSKPWDPVKLRQTVKDAFSDYEKELDHKRLVSDLVTFVQTHPSLFATDTETEGADVNKAS